MTRIIISGAGIGGLTLAHACLQRGMDVVLLEKSEALAEVGAGIQIPPNAMKVLEALGLAEAVIRRAFRPHAIETRMGKSGRQIFSIPLAETAMARWGSPYLHIHRADYIAALSDTLPEGVLLLKSCVNSFEEQDDQLSVHLENGESVEGDVLIGADGIHSTIREGLFGPQPAEFTGNVAWRAVVPIERLGDLAPRPTACAWFGAGKHVVTYCLGGEQANFVGVVERTDWTEEGWSIQGAREEALADFTDWHPIITTLIEQAENLHRWALFDRKPLPLWRQGRVCLLGDAAHPMLPFLAQGAAMAVEDAWVLAAALSEYSPKTGLEIYETTRKPRTSKVQAASRANMKTFHKPNTLSQLATYGPMWLAGRIIPSIVHRRMDWLYGHDVTRKFNVN